MVTETEAPIATNTRVPPRDGEPQSSEENTEPEYNDGDIYPHTRVPQ